MAKKKETTQKKEIKTNWLLEKKLEEEKPTDEKLTVLKTILEQNKIMIELLEKIVERIGG